MIFVSNAFDFTTASDPTAEVKPGDVVEIVTGYAPNQTDYQSVSATPGQQYEYIGEITDVAFDFATIDYANDIDWKAVSDFNVFTDIPYVNLNATNSDSDAKGFVVSYNDMRRTRLRALVTPASQQPTALLPLTVMLCLSLTTKNEGVVKLMGAVRSSASKTVSLSRLTPAGSRLTP